MRPLRRVRDALMPTDKPLPTHVLADAHQDRVHQSVHQRSEMLDGVQIERDQLIAENTQLRARAEKAELTARNWQEAYDKMGDTAAHPLSVRLRRSIANEPGGRRRN